MARETWTIQELHEELDRFEELLRGKGYAENSVVTYTDRSRRFSAD